MRRPVHRRIPSEGLRIRFGANLGHCREQLGISQHELAFRGEAHIGSISPLERGERLPRVTTFIKIAAAVEATPDELTAGILWTPAQATVFPGSFEVPAHPALAAEAAQLRKAGE
jgi:transcriptional regulator with XRE-family HTH domain